MASRTIINFLLEPIGACLSDINGGYEWSAGEE